MPKLSHFCGVCQEEINERLGYKVYSCELCLIRIHAKCMFLNASETKLKVLYEFNTCFDVKCPECKANYNENMASSLALKKDMEEPIKSIFFSIQFNFIYLAFSQNNKSGINKKETRKIEKLLLLLLKN